MTGLASELFIFTCALDDYELRAPSVCMYHCSHGRPWEADLLVGHGPKFLIAYTYLARLAIIMGKRRYRLRPKLHYLTHTILDVKTWPVNPGFVTCFLDEDFMGGGKSIASKCRVRLSEAGSQPPASPRELSSSGRLVFGCWRPWFRTHL